jgi:hypothetical protein
MKTLVTVWPPFSRATTRLATKLPDLLWSFGTTVAICGLHMTQREAQ